MDIAAFKTITASTSVLSGGGYFLSAHLAAGVDTASFTLYDAATSSGTVIVKLAAEASGGDAFCPPAALSVANGIFGVLTGTSPSGTVVFKP